MRKRSVRHFETPHRANDQERDWIPYQRTNFVTPAFPGYFSGHGTFSRSAAEILASTAGFPFFPGGLCILDPDTNEIRFNATRGFYCKVQSTTNLTVPFADKPGSVALTNTITGSQEFYLATMTTAP